MQQPSLFMQDKSVISLLYQQYASVILVYVRRLVSSWEDAEDIVLEVFLTALEKEQLLVAMSDSAQKAWLRRVAHNKVVDLYRRMSGSSTAPFEVVAEWLSDNKELTPEQAALQQETYALLLEHLSRLPQSQQEIVRLRFEAGLRCKDIATLINKPEGTVRSMLSRALNNLRKLYQQESGG
ncbi:MAG TPA: sigma-70 family RNA polymerase sigma factor [Ktedonobacteraceae bacterium]